MIAAALDTIIELGYYRASSNEIARRAGVTWGVIQYHFGSREQLLLAALERGLSDLNAYLSKATVEGGSLSERLCSYGEILWAHFGSERFLADLQIVVNLIHDPGTAQGTLDAMDSMLESNLKETTRLLDDAVAPLKLRPPDRQFVFAAFRGLALDDLLLTTFHPAMRSPRRRDRHLDAAAEAIADYLVNRGKSRT